MTATDVFFLFLRKSLSSNERLAFTRVIRNKIRMNDYVLCFSRYWNEPTLSCDELERMFAERLIWNTTNLDNNLGKNGSHSYCITLTSFMKYLLYYIPAIIGDSRHKNKYLERDDAEIPNGIGYKRFWERRFIKKWHDFLNEYIANGSFIFTYRSDIPDYKLKEGVTV